MDSLTPSPATGPLPLPVADSLDGLLQWLAEDADTWDDAQVKEVLHYLLHNKHLQRW